MSVVRFDIGSLRAPRKKANGFTEYDCYATRSGVFTYRNKDGSQRREYRPPSEVFKQDSLSSLALVPVTDNHPPRLLNTASAKEYSRGAVSQSVSQEDSFVRTSFVVHDDSLERKMKGGKSQISLGYTCDLYETPGETPEGERYDAVQRNIIYNHLAIVDRGRAGEEIRARMDADDEAYTEHEERLDMKKIRIDGVEYEVSDQVAQAYEKQQAAVKAEQDKLQARADAADEKIKTLQARADAAEDPKKLSARVQARVSLEVLGRKYLGNERFDSLSDRQLQDKIAIKLGVSESALKDKSDEYAKARFDAVVEEREERNDDLENARIVATGITKQDNEDAEEKAKRLNRESISNAWKGKAE